MRQAAFALSLLLFVLPAFGQNSPDAQTSTADCTFDDGKQISIQYNPGKGEEPRNGKIWEPGGSPMILFAQASLTLVVSPISASAYTVYTIPGKKDWTLIVNRNVKPGNSYDPSLDVARAPMETGEIDQPLKQLQVSFAHIAPKVCGLRLYYGRVGAFVDFKEQ